MNFKSILISIVCLNGIRCWNGSKSSLYLDEEPESCQMRNESLGICMYSYNCPQAFDELTNDQIQPTTCCSSEFATVVCCLDRRPKGVRISVSECASYREPVEYRPNCAMPPLSIFGGVRSDPGEFPHMTAIGWTEYEKGPIKWNCGGTLISRRFVLTAAHCVVREKPDVVRIGHSDLAPPKLRHPDYHENDYAIDRIYIHPGYKWTRAYNDIALLRLRYPVYPAQPACLWQKDDIDGDELEAIGYGLQEIGGRPSELLQKVNLTLIDHPTCTEKYVGARQLRDGLLDSQLCAGDVDGIKDTCKGDSGGPLQHRKKIGDRMEFHVVGVTSVGRGCATQTPGIYTKVSQYLDWVEGIVWE